MQDQSRSGLLNIRASIFRRLSPTTGGTFVQCLDLTDLEVVQRIRTHRTAETDVPVLR
jgi:hypothetical protein